MADKESLLQYVVQKMGPQKLQQAVDAAEQQLSQDPDVTAEVINTALQAFESVADDPESYKDVVAQAVQAGVIDPQDVPPEFDPIFVGVMIIALRELKARFSNQGSNQRFARGGLSRAAQELASKGRGGDTMLAHINPMEAEALRRMGGSGTVNPNTGLREYKGGLLGFVGKVVKAVAPVVATAVGGPWLGAAVGAGMGALGGGGLKGALLGGIGATLVPGGFASGLAGSVGNAVLGTGLGSMMSGVIGPQALGAGILGAGLGAVSGGGLKGALAGGLSAGLANTEAATNWANNIKQGGLSNIGTTILGGKAPVDPQGQAFSDAFTGAQSANNALNPEAGGQAFSDALTKSQAAQAANPLYATATTTPAVAGAAAADTGILGTGITGKNALLGLSALNALGGMTPPQALDAINNSALTEQQKADMSRALTNYTASWNQNTLPKAGTPEYEDMMNKISQGIGINFMNPTIATPDTTTTAAPVPVAKARGGKMPAKRGALSQVAMLASGTGSGRDDTINAKLSDGEYVIDAETVALLGNGSTKAGAAALDQMRKQIRQQKGKALAKGSFSPDAKSPLAYMKGGLK